VNRAESTGERPPNDGDDSFPAKQIKELLADYKDPIAWIYWTDYLVFVALGFSSLICSVLVSNAWLSTVSLLISLLSFYRALGFIHETVHQKHRRFMRLFVPVWNIVSGSLFFVMTFYYQCHLSHHSRLHYGTPSDPQYANFIERKPPVLFFLVVQSILAPVFFAVRALIIAPLHLLVPSIRPFVLRYLSSFARPGYKARYSRTDKRRIARYEIAHLLIWAGIFLAFYLGYIDQQFALHWLFVLFGVFALNSFRILGEHRYDYGNTDQQRSPEQVFFDSYNYTPLISELLYTTGLRYHALHHLVASIPYHNLPKAHRAIVDKLGPGSAYASVSSTSHLKNVCDLLRRTQAS
jgi:fatty acid desaturase